MAFKLDLTSPFTWPAKLARKLDVDGAFRRGALLAAMRVLAPRCHQDEFINSFGADWYIDNAEDFSVSNCDAFRAMNTLFIWDEGSSGAEIHEGEYYLWVSYPGENVFVDVIPRSSGHFNEPYDVETAAKRGDVFSCLGSKKPYRYWWQAFNRAIHKLTTSYPNYEEEAEFEFPNPDYSPLPDRPGFQPPDWWDPTMPEFLYEYGTIRVYPYSFSHLPDGTEVYSPDKLLVDWTSLEDAAKKIVVPDNKHFLITAENIDFSGVFYAKKKERENMFNPLQALWRDYAYQIGLHKYVSENAKTDEVSYKDSIAKYWRGETAAKFKDNRLMQLWGDWQGDSRYWRDEKPYHGLAAMLGYLEYFEKRNVGFAITCDVDDKLKKMDHTRRYKSRYFTATMELPFNSWDEDWSYEVDVKSLLANLEEKNDLAVDEESSSSKTPYAMNNMSRAIVPRVTTDVGGVRMYVGTIYKLKPEQVVQSGYEWFCDAGDYNGDNPFAVYMREGVEGMTAALNARANQVAKGAIEAGEVEPFTITVKLSMTGRVEAETPDADQDWSENDVVVNGILGGADGDATTTNTFTGGLPLIPDSRKVELNSRYFFIETTKSCAIKKAGTFNIPGRLKEEVGIEINKPLEVPLFDTSKLSGKLTVRRSGADSYYAVVPVNAPMIQIYTEDSQTNEDKIAIKPLPEIWVKTFDSNGVRRDERLFPPPQSDVDAYNEFVNLPANASWTIAFETPAIHLEIDEESSSLEYTGENLKGEPSNISGNGFTEELYEESRLQSLRSISFVKYAENVIYEPPPE